MPIYSVQFWHANTPNMCFGSVLTESIGMDHNQFALNYTLRKEVEVEAVDVPSALHCVIPCHLSSNPEPQVGVKVVDWTDNRETQEGDILVVVDTATRETKGCFFLKGRGEYRKVQFLQTPTRLVH